MSNALEQIKALVEEMDLFVDDYEKYASGDPKLPFSLLRTSLVNALQHYLDAKPALDAAIRALRQGGGWLPIESAPKGGRELILLLTPSGWPQVAYSNTWWTAGFSVECKPTGWYPIPQPLPAPPSPAKEG